MKQAEQTPVAQQTASRSDGLGDHNSSLVDHAYQQFMWRRLAGARDDLDAYCARFAGCQSALGKVIEAHLGLEKKLGLVSDICPVPWPQPGEKFLGFTLLRLLGQGTFGRVFLASEAVLGERRVAVKISLRGWVEAGILGRIDHPNVVRVNSVQIHQPTGLTAVCMPYLGNATLSHVVAKVRAAPNRARAEIILDAAREASFPEESSSEWTAPAAVLRRGTYADGVRHLGAQMAEALAFIHERGICHRDLKPSNVLVTPAGTSMLLDFNLSADAKEAVAKLGGTLPYMSAEQLLASDRQGGCDPALLDGRADIFSLGVILYELLAGAHPFGPVAAGLSVEELGRTLLERQRHGPRPLRQLRPEVDKPLARLVERCLAYNPADRPQSAAELAAALRRQLTRLWRARRWVRRHPRRLGLTTVLVLAACALTAILLLSRPPYSERQFQSGLASYRQGQCGEAVHRFNEALDAQPTFTSALFARGRAYLRWAAADKRYFNSAIADFQAADESKPDGRNKACVAYCWNRLGQHGPAIDFYNSAIHAGFAPAALFNNLGKSHLKLKNLDEARRNLDRAIALDSKLQAAFHNRAEVWLEKTLRLRQSSVQGKVLPATRKEIAEAVENGVSDIRQALAIGPGTVKLYRDAAYLCAVGAAEDPQWVPTAIEYLTLAVDHGHDPTLLEGDRLFKRLTSEPRFRALTKRTPPSQPPQRVLLFLDPINSTSE